MDTNTLELLNRIYATVDAIVNEENQDRSMVVEMSQAMLNDLIEDGELKPIVDYIKHYGTIFDNAEEAEEFAAGI